MYACIKHISTIIHLIVESSQYRIPNQRHKYSSQQFHNETFAIFANLMFREMFLLVFARCRFSSNKLHFVLFVFHLLQCYKLFVIEIELQTLFFLFLLFISRHPKNCSLLDNGAHKISKCTRWTSIRCGNFHAIFTILSLFSMSHAERNYWQHGKRAFSIAVLDQMYN